MKRLILLMVLLLLCAGCSSIKEGRVIEKRYEPAHTQTMLMPMGKALMPMIQSIPDKWEIVIQGNDIKTGGIMNKTCPVSEEVYNSIEIGDRYEIVKEGRTQNDV